MKATTFKKLLELRDNLLSVRAEFVLTQQERRGALEEQIDQEFDYIRDKALNPLFTYQKKEVVPYPKPTSDGGRTTVSWAHDCDFNTWKGNKLVEQHPKGRPNRQNGNSKTAMTRAMQRITTAIRSYTQPPEVTTTLSALREHAQLLLDIISDECGRDSEKEKESHYLAAFENVNQR